MSAPNRPSARRFAIVALAAAVAFAAGRPAVVFAQEDEEVRVCPSCGAEASGPAAKFCASCGAALDGSAGTPAPAAGADDFSPADAAPAGQLSGGTQTAPQAAGFDPAAAVRAVSVADAAAASGSANPAFKLAALRDTLRAAALFPGALPQDRVAALVAARNEALAALSFVPSAPCPVCGGTKTVAAPKPKNASGGPAGVRRLEDSAVTSTAPQLRVTCRFCGGSGFLRRVRDRAAVVGDARLGAAAFSRAAEAQGRSEAFGVHWSAADAAALRDGPAEAAARAALRGVHDDCDKCAGTGTVPCPACDGWAKAVCKADFHSRRATPANASGVKPKASMPYTRIEDSLMDPVSASTCPVCGGGADSPRPVRCAECSGRGAAACRTCKGSGHGR